MVYSEKIELKKIHNKNRILEKMFSVEIYFIKIIKILNKFRTNFWKFFLFILYFYFKLFV